VTVIAGLQGFGRRHRVTVAVAGALACAVLLGLVLGARRDQLAKALATAPWWTLTLAAVLQVVALLARTEAWHVTIEAAGGRVSRRVLFRASSTQVFGSLLNGQLGAAARIFALRRSSAAVCPQVPTLIAAEVPILAIEAGLAALASFTLVGPLGLPWWLPLLLLGAAVLLVAGLRNLARRWRDGLWSGLAVLRSAQGRSRIIALVLVAVFAQIARNWLMLDAVGVHASVFDATAVLIAMVTLSQLPVGPSVGAASVVLILGADGAALAAAAYAGWAGIDRLWMLRPAGWRRPVPPLPHAGNEPQPAVGVTR
jgi:uncharacterized membrane protein YbhN (UPF0104 family)